MAERKIAHPSIDDRRAKGLEARDRAPLSSHTKWRPAADRADPVALLEEQDATREPDLVPVRHGRMMVSPFTFYRGAAKIMAADLADTPVAGLEAQLCGDAHLSNFGMFASPVRILLFDVNDFDETLPGPFEYDVKRMAASFAIAGRNNGFSPADTRAATLASVRAYREAMASFAQMGTMDIWYAHLDEDELMASIRSAVAGTAREEKTAKKAEKADKPKKAPKKAEKRAAAEDKAARQDEKAAKTAEKRAEKTGREGAHPRQPAGAVQARRAGRRAVPDRQPAADRCPGARPGRHLRPVPRPGHAGDPRAVPRLPGHPARRRAQTAGAVPDRGHGPQGGRCRQRRHRGIYRSAAGPRRAGPAVPADQGGHGLGAGGPPAQEPSTGSTASGWCRGSG